MIRMAVMALTAVFLVSCQNYTEVERETGYKGKARVNPWLAAERFAVRMGYPTKSALSWTAPGRGEAVWIMPASALNNESFTRRTNDWVQQGGHLILLLDWADSETSDWSFYSQPPEVMPALDHMLESARIHIHEKTPVRADHLEFLGKTYKAGSDSRLSVSGKPNGSPGAFISKKSRKGRISVIADGRMFRNRWIGDGDHAGLLNDLLESAGRPGAVGFMRSSGLSLWEMLTTHLWPVLLGVAVWTFLWLWKNLSRFGPIESAEVPSVLRGYEYHLDALGHFQWRIDHGASLLVSLREQTVELGQRSSQRAGRHGDDLFQYLADRSALPRERVLRALTAAAPADAAMLTRITADLQSILKVLHHPDHS